MALVSLPPNPGFVDVQWTLMTPAQNNRSAWTGARRVAGLPGAARWSVKATVKPVIADDARAAAWRAFFAKLDGLINTFPMPFTLRAQQSVISTPAYVKTTAAAGAYQMVLKGLPPSTPILIAGQAIDVTLPSGRRQLLLLTTDLVADGVGEATATFRSLIREAAPPNSPVEVRFPVCQVALTSPEFSWSETRGRRHDFTIDAEEAY